MKHDIAYWPNDNSACLHVLNTLATPANVSTLVSAHCFSAVSLEWCIKMLPLVTSSSLYVAAVPDSFFTLSNRGNNTCEE